MPQLLRGNNQIMKADKVALNGLRVLAVDNDADSLDLLAFVLEQYGIEVAKAASASQALEIVAQVKPQLLLVDIVMPDLDGYTLLCQIRNLQATNSRPTPAIALTAMVGDDQRAEAMAVGFQVYLTKPFDMDELITVIAKLCGRN